MLCVCLWVWVWVFVSQREGEREAGGERHLDRTVDGCFEYFNIFVISLWNENKKKMCPLFWENKRVITGTSMKMCVGVEK